MNPAENIRAALAYIPAHDRETWVRMGMAVKSELGEEGFPIWDEWSQQDATYKAQDARAVWKSITPQGGVTVGTLYHEAQQRGFRLNGISRPTADEIARRAQLAAETETAERQEHQEAKYKAQHLWRQAGFASPDHPYLVRKGVKPVSTLREILLTDALPILGYVPNKNGEPLSGRLLVVPIKLGDQVSTLELIDEAGLKSALAGGVKASGYWAAQRLPHDHDTKVLIGEGVATCLSACEATGYPVVAALSSANLEKVARQMRERYPTGTIVVLADLGNGQEHAEQAARSVSGSVAVPDFGADHTDRLKDFNDLAKHRGLGAVRTCIEDARAPAGEPRSNTDSAPQPAITGQQVDVASANETTEQTISRLAKLCPVDYDRARDSEAGRLKVRVSTLDAEVAKARPMSTDECVDEVLFPTLEPWPTPVDGAELLDDLAKTARTFVVLPEYADRAIALWIAFTYLTDTVKVAPLLAFTSPEKRCGKTSALGVLTELAARPLSASNITASALFRSIEKWAPTLIIDEADTFIRESDELRGVINSGHTRLSAFVIRTVGDAHEPRLFATWGAKAIALIGGLPDTLADRSIVIELRRKLPSERVQKLRHVRGGALLDLARKLVRWTADSRDKVGLARPIIPESLHDRAQDNWEPLLAIADVAGGTWPADARQTAVALSGGSPDGDSLKVELLRDIRSVFTSKATDRLGSEELVECLTADKERPWAEYRNGKPLSQKQLGSLLSAFRITSNTVRFNAETAKGYRLEQFEDAFQRYLPASDPSHRHKPASMRVVTDQGCVTQDDVLRIGDPSQASIHAGCDGVTDQRAEFGGSARVEQF